MIASPLPDPSYDPAFYDGVLPKRFFAWAIDAALMLVAMLILALLTFGVAFFLWVPIHAGLAFLYRWLTIRHRSATLGMRVMNIELRGPSGQHLTPAEAALHTGIFLTCAIFFVFQLISMGLMIARPHHRGLADEAIGSVMLNRVS